MKWIRGKKKKKPEKSNTTPVAASGNARWLESFAKQLQPQGTLKADGDLTKMKIFKASMFTWMDYLSREGVKIDNKLYWDILSNQCNQTMRVKLEAVKGIQKMGETKMWELIESIYQGSNPGYIRR